MLRARHDAVGRGADEVVQSVRPQCVDVFRVRDKVHDLPLLVAHVDDSDPARAVILVRRRHTQPQFTDVANLHCVLMHPRWGEEGRKDAPFPPLSDGQVMVVGESVTITGLIFLEDTLSMGTPDVSCFGSSEAPLAPSMGGRVFGGEREDKDVSERFGFV